MPPPERGRGRPPRSFENIVSVAADLVDEFGVDGVNMRLLAERLETGTATLYRHVTGKDELMVYVLDSRMGEIVGAYDALAARPRTWREALERIAFAYRRFLVAHPNVLPLLVGRLPIGPHALTIRERSLAALTERGFSQELAARAFTTLLQYVVGSAVTQAGLSRSRRGGRNPGLLPLPGRGRVSARRSGSRGAHAHTARGGVRRGPGDRARWHRSHPPAQRALAGGRPRDELVSHPLAG